MYVSNKGKTFGHPQRANGFWASVSRPRYEQLFSLEEILIWKIQKKTMEQLSSLETILLLKIQL